MKRLVFNVVASLFCLSAFGQTVDMQFAIPKYPCVKPRFTVQALEYSPLYSDILICKSSLPLISYRIKPPFLIKAIENSTLFSDTPICKLSFPFTPYTLQKKIIRNEVEQSVVINTSYKNLSAPTFSQPCTQTMNWWQLLLKAGIGLTRGLAFGDYNSDFTLDD